MHTMHCAAPTVYRVHAKKCITPYSTYSTQSGVVLLCLLVVSCLHSLPILKGHLVMCLFIRLLLHWVVFDFVFPDLFLFFFHIWRDLLGNFDFVHFFLFVLILRISGFPPFSRNSRSSWFLFCLVSRLGRQPFTLLNPLTS